MKKMKNPIKEKLSAFISEMESVRVDFGASYYEIGKHRMITAACAGSIKVNNDCKLFTALAFLASVGKTIEIVDMPNEMSEAVNEWHKACKSGALGVDVTKD